MPTLDDLRATFADLEQHAPKPQPLRLSPKPIPHRPDPRLSRGARRRWPATVLASAAVVAVAVGVVLAERPDQSAHPAASRPPARHVTPTHARVAAFRAPLPAPGPGQSPDLSFGFAVATVPGYRVTATEIDTTYQLATITSSDGAVKGELFVYYAGAFDPTQAKRGTAVSVDGQPGYYARLTMPGQDGTLFDVLAWRYAHNGWAVINLWDGAAGRTATSKNGRMVAENKAKAMPSRAGGLPDLAALRVDELRLAAATHAATVATRVPVKISGLAGLRVTQLDPAPVSGGLSVADRNGVSWDFGWGNSAISPGEKPGSDTTSFGGRTWIVYRNRLNGTIMSLGLSAPGFGMTITPTVGRVLTLAQYRQFLTHVHFPATLGSPSTWFDASTALP